MATDGGLMATLAGDWLVQPAAKIIMQKALKKREKTDMHSTRSRIILTPLNLRLAVAEAPPGGSITYMGKKLR